MTRTKREQEERVADERQTSWRPASLLPTPPDADGQYVYRWIRVSSMGNSDNKNTSAKFREGWVPVRAEDFPEFEGIVSDRNSEFKGNIEIGGLLLCRNSHENVKARREYYGNLNRRQIESVENNYLRESNPKMPMFSDQKSRTTFGTGN